MWQRLCHWNPRISLEQGRGIGIEGGWCLDLVGEEGLGWGGGECLAQGKGRKIGLEQGGCLGEERVRAASMLPETWDPHILAQLSLSPCPGQTPP